ncbi:unnamed protein product [Rhizopus microsporus]
MLIIGGVMPNQMPIDEEPTAYTYDIDLGRWNSFSLPRENRLNRQGAGCTVTKNGTAYIWGGKRSARVPIHVMNLPANIYRFDSVHPENSSFIPLTVNPPLRYAHTQTLIANDRIVILGGFDGLTGNAISLSDVWVFDIKASNWTHITAELDRDNKPENRSSHSQVLMPDGYSILIYGGYDGYHVYNDVAVLDTRTWKWTVKNTNAALQGRADHTATLVGTNMIVAFGFSGVSTSLTVMSDIEVLDINTWSWTSVYTPSGLPFSDDTDSGTTQRTDDTSSYPSLAIIAGAVTGGLVVFILILIAFYLFNVYQQRTRSSSSSVARVHSLPSYITISEIKRHDNSPKRSDTIGTSTTVVANDTSPVTVLPSPWKDTQEWVYSSIPKVVHKPDDTCSQRQNDLEVDRDQEIEEKEYFDRQEFILLSDEVCQQEF